ncbi:uncharacterized protein LOC133915154 [Phragmites australis]|uniref:uncharacterized protein LOC133915154 n=1 Tax=Phragmites australis TaxID=29695 RepID=UPI002D797581|nr:uncharacterized protein LOC133915154 [Phragmites australis]
MAGGDEGTPVNFPTRRKARPPQGSVYERPLERQKEGACTLSPSVSNNKSPPQLVAPVQLPKPLHSISGPSSSGSVGSDSGAAPFDICMHDNKCSVKLNRSLLEINREKRRENMLSKDVPPLQHLRPGMVLLNKFLKPNDQVKIVKLCQQLGVGAGGFYRPSYRDGAKLNLWMMCLGMNWDPDSRSYGDKRPFDGAQPPNIPEEFRKFVQDAIQASHQFLEQGRGAANAEEELPPMSPDICLVNFYNSSGRLGLHQDKDETRTSLVKGLPVVSFSLGETAEFLYGDVRDVDKVSKVDLESGDVLIFGGTSRLIFHGVSNVKPKTAPKWLTDETSLRPGRLNLTFRQY